MKVKIPSTWKDDFSLWAAVFTVLGVSFTGIINDAYKAHVVFFVLILSIGLITYRIWKSIKENLKCAFPQGYLPISAHARYSTTDGKHINYQVLRAIQNKTPTLDKFTHKFYWTGSKKPSVSSLLQNTGEVIEGDNNLSQVELKFRKALFFNEAEIVHLSMDIDDSDGSSEPYISLNVESPIRTITFTVELLHAPKGYSGNKAKLERLPSDRNVLQKEPELISPVEFNILRKSFETTIPNPETGYRYTLTWEKPTVRVVSRPSSRK